MANAGVTLPGTEAAATPRRKRPDARRWLMVCGLFANGIRGPGIPCAPRLPAVRIMPVITVPALATVAAASNSGTLAETVLQTATSLDGLITSLKSSLQEIGIGMEPAPRVISENVEFA